MKRGTQADNLQLPARDVVPLVAPPDCSHPVARKGRRSVFLRAQRKIEKRRAALAAYDALRSKGLTAAQAAKEVRISQGSLWRWRQRIEPRTALCGRKAVLEKLSIPRAIILRVQKLQLAGTNNCAAWKQIAEDPACPPIVAEYLRAAKSLPPSLLRATKLAKIRTTIITTPEFTYLEPKGPPCT